MANYNLAQDEPYLKQLDKALKEISKLHHEIHDTLLALEEYSLKAAELLTVSWPKVTELFLTVGCLRTNRRAFDQEQRRLDLKAVDR